MNNNEMRNFDALDILAIASFIIQMQNIHGDNEYHKHLMEEINKIHQEIKEIKILVEKEGGNGAE